MPTYLRSLLLLALGCGALALWLKLDEPAGNAAPSPQTPATAPAAVPAAVKVVHVTHTGPRFWYAEKKFPQLNLPDGRHEIVRSVLNITTPMRFGSFVWNDKEIPQGPVWVRIDLERQLLSVFRAGHEIGTAVILYGDPRKPTPTGSFTVLDKRKDYHSRSYDAPMPYMLRLTDDGVAIHGSDVREDRATHGCIGVPLEFARHLFAVAQKGDPVVILPAKHSAERA